MSNKKKNHPSLKSKLHPRNKHRERYNFQELIEVHPNLKKYVQPNKYGDESINFFDAEAVKMLNTALLKKYYQIQYWDIPANYLCPPIPGRADYIHHIVDVLASYFNNRIPRGKKFVCLDVGVGANCIYPIIGHVEFGWSFIGSEVDTTAFKSAQKIIRTNEVLQGAVELRKQNNPQDIFYGILDKEERIDLTICNPPFHASEEEARKATLRKLRNLKGQKITKVDRSFGGQHNELWYPGGEKGFVKVLVRESKKFASSCFLFSTQISKASNLDSIKAMLNAAGATEVHIIPMGQGNKVSRIVAWTFLNPQERANWVRVKWNRQVAF